MVLSSGSTDKIVIGKEADGSSLLAASLFASTLRSYSNSNSA